MSVTTQPRALATITGSPAGWLHGRITYVVSSASSELASGSGSPMCVSRYRWSKAKSSCGVRLLLNAKRTLVAIPNADRFADRSRSDLEDPVASGAVWLVVEIRAGRDAAHEHRPRGTRELLGHIAMLVAVHDQIGAVRGDHLGERVVIAQAADPALRALAGGRMVDRDQPGLAGEPRIGEHAREASELAGADPAVRGEPRRGTAGRHADERELAADADERPAEIVVGIGAILLGPRPAGVARREVAEQLGEQRDALGHVRVVVAGQDGDVAGAVRKMIEFLTREYELLAQREVRDIARTQHVVDALRVDIGDHVVERRDVIVAAAIRQQVQRADPALVREVEPARAVVRQQVQVRTVREFHDAHW